MPIFDAHEFGAALRQCRKVAGLTQVEAAKLTGVTQRLWSECERGKRARVGFETALRMLQTVGADLEVRPRNRLGYPA